MAASLSHDSPNRRVVRGMTLVELLVSLMVISIVLTAVATLAFAMNSARAGGDAKAEELARLRVTAVKLPGLIRNSKLVCYSSPSEIVLWYADNNGDNKINLDELVHVITGNGESLSLQYLSLDGNSTVPLSHIGSFDSGWWKSYGAVATEIVLIRDCTAARIAVNAAAPNTAWVTVSATLDSCQYQFSASLLARSIHLVSGGSIREDDD